MSEIKSVPATTTIGTKSVFGPSLGAQTQAIVDSNPQFSQVQQRLLELDAANLLIDKNIERQTARLANVAKAKLQLFVVLVVMIAIFIYQKYKAIKTKWKDLIEQLSAGACNTDKAHRNALAQAPYFGPLLPSFSECSPFFIALCLEYPFFSGLRFSNTAFPLAVKYAFTSSCFSCVMAKIDGPFYMGATHIPKMFEVSQMCTLKSSNGDCNPQVIVCEAFKQVYMSRKSNSLTCYINPLYPSNCYPTCQVDQYYSLTQNSESAGTAAGMQMATGGVFAGHAVGSGVGTLTGSAYTKFKGAALTAEEAAKTSGTISNTVGLVISVATGVGMYFAGKKLHEAAVSDAQQDCQNSLKSQLCLGKSGYCQLGTMGDTNTKGTSDLDIYWMSHRRAMILKSIKKSSPPSAVGDDPEVDPNEEALNMFANWPVKQPSINVGGRNIAYASCYMSDGSYSTTPVANQQIVFSDPQGRSYTECCFTRNSCLCKTCIGGDTQSCYSDDPVIQNFLNNPKFTKKDLQAELFDKGYGACVMGDLGPGGVDDAGSIFYIVTCDQPMRLVGNTSQINLPDSFLTNPSSRGENYCGPEASHFGTRRFICPQSFWGCDQGVIQQMTGRSIVTLPHGPS